jgi:hypothetical protein
LKERKEKSVFPIVAYEPEGGSKNTLETRFFKMRDFREILFSQAFSVIAGEAYNRVSYGLRQDDDPRHRLLYEVVLDEGQNWAYMTNKVYPFLVRYLNRKSIDPKSGKGAVVSLFFKDHCYLIECPKFFKAFLEVEGLTPADFDLRVAQWLSG